MNKPIFAFALVLILGGMWLAYSAFSSKDTGETEVISKSHVLKRQNFSLPDLQGNMQNFSQWNDKVVVLNFWATWCPPCRREIPDFAAVYQQYRDQGLVIVGVGTDDRRKVAGFVKQFKVPYPILVGENTAMKISYQYGNHTGALPYTIIIDKKGIIRYRAGGLMTRSKLLSIIKPLL